MLQTRATAVRLRVPLGARAHSSGRLKSSLGWIVPARFGVTEECEGEHENCPACHTT